jgi:hypothetical protein
MRGRKSTVATTDALYSRGGGRVKRGRGWQSGRGMCGWQHERGVKAVADAWARS